MNASACRSGTLSRLADSRRWIAALAACVTATGLAAVEPRLVPVGVMWSFHIVAEASPAPSADWPLAGFDDGGWSNGVSGFSTYGSGYSGEATYLGLSAVTSACFRARFPVSNPAEVQWLVLRMDYTSGFVAYLNGREIARRGVEGDPPRFDAVATPHARYATEEVDVSKHRDALVADTNVLAIQLHGSTLPAADLVLVPELCANFTRGPFLQNVTAQGAEILWRTPVPSTTAVEFGNSPAFGQLLMDEALTTNHLMTLTGLSPDTECFYRVVSGRDTNSAASPVYRFRTMSATGDISFAVLGDSGSGCLPQLQVASCLATAGVDLVLHTGDITYPNLNRAIVDTRCLSIYGDQMRGTPFFLTVGNHELYGDPLVTYLETFRMPTNNATGTPHFYSFDHGDAHFVSLFVPTLANFAGMPPYALTPGSAQLQWLTNDLAAATRPWRIVFLHSPLTSSGGHRRDDYNANGVADRLELQERLLPVLAQFGVQAVFSGHDHCYEHLAFPGGPHCFVSGGGGGTLYGLMERDPLSQRFESRYHHLRATIAGGNMQVLAVDQSGVAFDSVIVPRVSAPNLRAGLIGDSVLRLIWNTGPGRRYQLESAGMPTGEFLPVDNPALPLTATNYQVTFDVERASLPGDQTAGFFRVRMLPP